MHPTLSTDNGRGWQVTRELGRGGVAPLGLAGARGGYRHRSHRPMGSNRLPDKELRPPPPSRPLARPPHGGAAAAAVHRLLTRIANVVWIFPRVRILESRTLRTL